MNAAVMEPFRPVVIAPTFNNGRMLGGVLNELKKLGIAVIVVNDGSTDDTAPILNKQVAADWRVVTHPRNCGKAAALHSGFQCARANSFTHGITIDTDGQHDVADVAPLVELASQHPQALIIGARPSDTEGYPLASRFGRFISNNLVRLESGARVSDSQCGLRVYPLEPLTAVRSYAGRFGFETEIITRLAWSGAAVYETPIRCIYDVAGGRQSHFRPIRDSIAAMGTHARLLGRAMLPWTIEKNRELTETATTGPIIERFLRWMNPLPLWREIRRGSGGKRLAASMSAGIFMATIPVYGLKTVLCLCIAKWFRLQPLVVLAVSSLNTPPVGPLLAAMSILAGHLLLHGTMPALSQYAPWRDGWWITFQAVAAEWIVGSVVVGATLALVTYWIARWSVRAARMPLASE